MNYSEQQWPLAFLPSSGLPSLLLSGDQSQLRLLEPCMSLNHSKWANYPPPSTPTDCHLLPWWLQLTRPLGSDSALRQTTLCHFSLHYFGSSLTRTQDHQRQGAGGQLTHSYSNHVTWAGTENLPPDGCSVGPWGCKGESVTPGSALREFPVQGETHIYQVNKVKVLVDQLTDSLWPHGW